MSVTPIPTVSKAKAKFSLQLLDLDGFLVREFHLRHQSLDRAGLDLSIFANERLAVGETVRLVETSTGTIVDGQTLGRES